MGRQSQALAGPLDKRGDTGLPPLCPTTTPPSPVVGHLFGGLASPRDGFFGLNKTCCQKRRVVGQRKQHSKCTIEHPRKKGLTERRHLLGQSQNHSPPLPDDWCPPGAGGMRTWGSDQKAVFHPGLVARRSPQPLFMCAFIKAPLSNDTRPLITAHNKRYMAPGFEHS